MVDRGGREKASGGIKGSRNGIGKDSSREDFYVSSGLKDLTFDAVKQLEFHISIKHNDESLRVFFAESLTLFFKRKKEEGNTEYFDKIRQLNETYTNERRPARCHPNVWDHDRQPLTPTVASAKPVETPTASGSSSQVHRDENREPAEDNPGASPGHSDDSYMHSPCYVDIDAEEQPDEAGPSSSYDRFEESPASPMVVQRRSPSPVYSRRRGSSSQASRITHARRRSSGEEEYDPATPIYGEDEEMDVGSHHNSVLQDNHEPEAMDLEEDESRTTSHVDSASQRSQTVSPACSLRIVEDEEDPVAPRAVSRLVPGGATRDDAQEKVKRSDQKRREMAKTKTPHSGRERMMHHSTTAKRIVTAKGSFSCTSKEQWIEQEAMGMDATCPQVLYGNSMPDMHTKYPDHNIRVKAIKDRWKKLSYDDEMYWRNMAQENQREQQTRSPYSEDDDETQNYSEPSRTPMDQPPSRSPLVHHTGSRVSGEGSIDKEDEDEHHSTTNSSVSHDGTDELLEQGGADSQVKASPDDRESNDIISPDESQSPTISSSVTETVGEATRDRATTPTAPLPSATSTPKVTFKPMKLQKPGEATTPWRPQKIQLDLDSGRVVPPICEAGAPPAKKRRTSSNNDNISPWSPESGKSSPADTESTAASSLSSHTADASRQDTISPPLIPLPPVPPPSEMLQQQQGERLEPLSIPNPPPDFSIPPPPLPSGPSSPSYQRSSNFPQPPPHPMSPVSYPTGPPVGYGPPGHAGSPFGPPGPSSPQPGWDGFEIVHCAFCPSDEHQSEYCTQYTTNATRYRRQKELFLCMHCLKRHSAYHCPKPQDQKMCTHCKRHYGHIALCKIFCK